MNSLRHGPLLILLLACCGIAGADHRPDAEWSWHLQSAGSDESRLSLYFGDRPVGIYNLDCDLSDVGDGEVYDGNASVDLVRPESNPAGLLVVSCDVGAHSRQIVIFDLARKSKQPVYSVSGSYTARWEMQDGELWIEYDEPCDTGPSVDCPDNLATIFERYPGPALTTGD